MNYPWIEATFLERFVITLSVMGWCFAFGCWIVGVGGFDYISKLIGSALFSQGRGFFRKIFKLMNSLK